MTRVFNRKELKYVIEKSAFDRITDEMNSRMTLDEHNYEKRPYKVYSIYFDTLDNELVRWSLENIYYRYKLRIRSYYGLDDPEAMIFLELKKKVNDVNNKRRLKMKLADALNFIETGKCIDQGDYIDIKVLSEIEQLLKERRFLPRVVIEYDRVAYEGDGGFRVTIDSNIMAYWCDIPEQRIRLTSEDEYVLELKVTESVPLWLSKLLAELRVYRQGYSKYGKIYMHRKGVGRQGVMC
jgi:hypothetical protein